MSAGLARLGQRQPDRAAAVHEEAVERLRQRLHAVDVGHQREGGLRLADRDHMLGLELAEPAAGADRPRDLGEDVVGERVAGVLAATRSARGRWP